MKTLIDVSNYDSSKLQNCMNVYNNTMQMICFHLEKGSLMNHPALESPSEHFSLNFFGLPT